MEQNYCEEVIKERNALERNCNAKDKEIAELKAKLKTAGKIIEAQQDLNIAYRLSKRPKEKSLDILSKNDVTQFLKSLEVVK